MHKLPGQLPLMVLNLKLLACHILHVELLGLSTVAETLRA